MDGSVGIYRANCKKLRRVQYQYYSILKCEITCLEREGEDELKVASKGWSWMDYLGIEGLA